MSTGLSLIGSIVNSIDVSLESRSEVVSKSEELLRKIQMKFSFGHLKKLEKYKLIVLIELSCRLLKLTFSKNKLILFVPGANNNEYQQLLTTFKNVLELRIENKPLLDVLFMKFNVPTSLSINEVLMKYKELHVDKLDPNRKKLINLESPLYHAVAFYITAKSNKVCN